MKILIAGNSQAAALKKAHDNHPEVLGSYGSVYFYVIAGGPGPNLTVDRGKLVVTRSSLKFPPYAVPPDTPDIPVADYDAVIISALGYVDGGVYHQHPLTQYGLLMDFQPKNNTITDVPISLACYQAMIDHTLKSQQGFVFLDLLRQQFEKPIIVQPFPLLSTIVSVNPRWALNQMYEDVLGAHRFFNRSKDQLLAKVCEERSVKLLPYPSEEWRVDCFTPAELMSVDDLHPNERYGKMVLEQVAEELSSPTMQYGNTTFRPPLFLIANNFSGGGWSKGVLERERRSNMFYFLAEKGQPIKVKVGDTLVFAESGKARITQVASLPQETKLSVFVTVDKDLDPEGDGFPNKILVE